MAEAENDKPNVWTWSAEIPLGIDHGFGNIWQKKRRTKRRPGRPATGRDPIIPVRLPKKLLFDTDAWAAFYRNEHGYGMTRSIAIRCLILLGLDAIKLRVVDPKTMLTYEGETPPLLKFYTGRRVDKWLRDGTGKAARLTPPKPSKLLLAGGKPSKSAVEAAADRAEARSKKQITK